MQWLLPALAAHWAAMAMFSPRLFAAAGRYSKEFPGDCSGGATPVPIPNTEVKPSSADGTARATLWESRTSPGIYFGSPIFPYTEDRAFLI